MHVISLAVRWLTQNCYIRFTYFWLYGSFDFCCYLLLLLCLILWTLCYEIMWFMVLYGLWTTRLNKLEVKIITIGKRNMSYVWHCSLKYLTAGCVNLPTGRTFITSRNHNIWIRPLTWFLPSKMLDLIRSYHDITTDLWNRQITFLLKLLFSRKKNT